MSAAIYGIGTDIVDVSRIEQSLTRNGHRFRDRIFTTNEIAYCESLAEAAKFRSFAARFAAKEAVSKAFRLGIGPAFDWVEIEITRDETTGAPSVVLHGRAARFAEQEAVASVHVSLSHTDDQAIAYAIVERVT